MEWRQHTGIVVVATSATPWSSTEWSKCGECASPLPCRPATYPHPYSHRRVRVPATEMRATDADVYRLLHPLATVISAARMTRLGRDRSSSADRLHTPSMHFHPSVAVPCLSSPLGAAPAYTPK